MFMFIKMDSFMVEVVEVNLELWVHQVVQEVVKNLVGTIRLYQYVLLLQVEDLILVDGVVLLVGILPLLDQVVYAIQKLIL